MKQGVEGTFAFFSAKRAQAHTPTRRLGDGVLFLENNLAFAAALQIGCKPDAAKL